MKKGYTLAEALTTLMVIGVVASLTMPTLFSGVNEQKKMTMLKKVYAAFTLNVKHSLHSVSSDGSGMACSTLSCTGNWSEGRTEEYCPNGSEGECEDIDCTTTANKYHPACVHLLANPKRFNVEMTCDDCFKDRVLPPAMEAEADNVRTYILKDQSHMAIMDYNGTNDSDCSHTEESVTYTYVNSEGETVTENVALCGIVVFDIDGKKGANFPGADMFAYYISDEAIEGSHLIPIGYTAQDKNLSTFNSKGNITSAIDTDDDVVAYNKTAEVMVNGWKFKK